MARFDPGHASLSLNALSDKVIVLSGGSTGIGAATVDLLHSHGVKVVSGDIVPPKQSVGDYFRTDITKYEDVLALFRYAFDKYGGIDHAIANAGVIEHPGWFQPDGIKSLQKPPPDIVVDVNLKGTLYFAHIALQYLAVAKGATDHSLTMLSSQAGFKETPGLFIYQTTKHGILGLMRSLRLYTPATFGVRVNAICPSMTTTQMVAGIQDAWTAGGNPVNYPEDIAKIISGVVAAGPGTEAIWYDDAEGYTETQHRRNVGGINWEDSTTGLNGRALYVLGGEAYDIEEGLDRTEDLWLGKGISRKLERAQKGLGKGDDWVPS
ncbi:hypothetical protein LTR96_011374 [Exophiala xenobiotica]|nr:hypothetical protein LTR41_011618 [Exophiala xenobiotica]KAK5215233.1 hypothetical protein LTR72_011702 [Exophiala xenobiotica]KAK5220953.1 hypothetical protein LTR47_010970 [Exophiala xenobiotica]KAK5243774.1 hypothetical protein LTS06_010535 [Exophiala xenobiotica]KAK5263203.1 hypothetical protein LTR96_011374 [Exophiala xenobiotica]